MRDDNVCKGILVPGLPHPLLCPEKMKDGKEFVMLMKKLDQNLKKAGQKF